MASALLDHAVSVHSAASTATAFFGVRSASEVVHRLPRCLSCCRIVTAELWAGRDCGIVMLQWTADVTVALHWTCFSRNCHSSVSLVLLTGGVTAELCAGLGKIEVVRRKNDQLGTGQNASLVAAPAWGMHTRRVYLLNRYRGQVGILVKRQGAGEGRRVAGRAVCRSRANASL